MNTAVVLPAILLGRAIDRALAFERGQATTADVGWAALALFGGTLLTEVPRMGKRWWLMTANARIRANVRADAFRGVLGWPMADLQRTPPGDLMARIVGDVEVLGVGVRELTIETWDTLLFSLSFVVAMLVIDARLTVLSLLPVPLAMLLAHAAGRWVASRTIRAREASADLTSTLQEDLAGVRVLRLFGRASASVERVARLSQRFAERNLALVRLKAGLQPVYATIMTSGVVLIVWQGSERVIAGAMTVGAFVAYLELFLRLVNRGHRIPQLINSLQSGAAAYERLRLLLAPPLSVAGEPRFASFRARHVAGITRPSASAGGCRRGPASLSLQNLEFQYPGAAAPVLQGLNPRDSGRGAGGRDRPGRVGEERPRPRDPWPVSGQLGVNPRRWQTVCRVARRRTPWAGRLSAPGRVVVLGLAPAEHRVRSRRPWRGRRRSPAGHSGGRPRRRCGRASTGRGHPDR